jgi:hypothetical protein
VTDGRTDGRIKWLPTLLLFKVERITKISVKKIKKRNPMPSLMAWNRRGRCFAAAFQELFLRSFVERQFRSFAESVVMLGWKAIFTLVVVALMFFVLSLNKFNGTLVIFLSWTLYDRLLELLQMLSYLMPQVMGCHADELKRCFDRVVNPFAGHRPLHVPHCESLASLHFVSVLRCPFSADSLFIQLWQQWSHHHRSSVRHRIHDGPHASRQQYCPQGSALVALLFFMCH